jgi:hypothetical protein
MASADELARGRAVRPVLKAAVAVIASTIMLWFCVPGCLPVEQHL